MDFRLMIVGSSQTGKISFLKKYTSNYSINTFKKSGGLEFGSRIFEKNNILYKLEIWEIGGNIKNEPIVNLWAKDSHGCIIFSDATNTQTREYSLKLKKMVLESSQFKNKIPCILIENKRDLLEENQIENHEKELKEFAEKNEFDGSFLTSIKTGKNMMEAMEFLTEEIIKRFDTLIEKKNEFYDENKKIFQENKYKNNITLDDINFSIDNDILKIEIGYYSEYKYENSFSKLKKKYEFLECVNDENDFISLIKSLKEKNKIKIKFIMKNKLIQISAIFMDIYGDEQEITFELIYENFNRKKLLNSLVKKMIKIKGKKNIKINL